MYTVCLVEDNPDSRELLVDCLRSCQRLQLLDAYDTAEEALRELPRINPDVVLMDIKLPGISGIDCLIALRQLTPPCNAAVVMLTEHEDGNLIFQALKAGAEGYLLKRHATARELQDAIVEVMAGGRPFDRTVAQQITAFFRTLPPSVCSAQAKMEPAVLALTPCEQEVLKFIAQGLTYKEVAGGLNVSLDTVRKHLQSIFRKLQIHCRTDPRLYSAANFLGQHRDLR